MMGRSDKLGFPFFPGSRGGMLLRLNDSLDVEIKILFSFPPPFIGGGDMPRTMENVRIIIR